MPAEERHADDLLVFIQDMVGRISGDLWMPRARSAFLKAYGEQRNLSTFFEKNSSSRRAWRASGGRCERLTWRPQNWKGASKRCARSCNYSSPRFFQNAFAPYY